MSGFRAHRDLRLGVGLALLAATGLGLLDGCYALVMAAQSFETASERAWFLMLAALSLLLPAVLFGLLQGGTGLLLSLLAQHLARSTSATRTVPWQGRLCAALCAPAVAYVCAQVFRGPQAQRIPGHDVLAVLLGVFSLWLLSHGVVAVLRGVSWVNDAGPGRSHRAALLFAAFLPLAIAAYLADQRVLPRLYPWFHLGLLLITLGLFQVAAMFLALGTVHLRRRWLNDEFLMISVSLLAVIAGSYGLSRLDRALSLRGVALEHTRAVGRVLQLESFLHRGVESLRAGRAVFGDAGTEGQGGIDDTPVAPGPGPILANTDVFLITVDALRYDRLTQQTMPQAFALSQAGITFEHAYTQVPHTSFAVATLLTGKPVYALLTMGEDAADHETLPVILRRARYKTAAFFPPSVFYIEHDRLRKLEESAYGFEYVKYEYLAAPQRTDQVIDFLSAENPERAFVWVHYLEPHEPYDVHPGGPKKSASDRERYDGEVRFVDQQIGRLVAYLRAHRPSALLILAADHGEEFGEHGGRYHGTTLYEEQEHVPLFLCDLQTPARLLPRRIAGPVGLIDVAPTILGLLDIAPSARMRGHDLGPWLLPEKGGQDLPRWPVFAEIGHKKMAVVGSDKLICDLSTESCATYDLVRDPGEQRNRIEAEPDKARALRLRLDRFLSEASRFERDRTGTQARDQAAQKVLLRGRMGDVSAAPDLARLITLGQGEPLSGVILREATQLLAELSLFGPATGTPHLAADPGIRAALAQAHRSQDEQTRHWAAAGLLRLRQGPNAPDEVQEVQAVVRDETAAPRLRLAAALSLALADRTPDQTKGAQNVDLDAVRLWIEVLPLAMELDDPDRVRPLLLLLGQSRDRRALLPLLAQLSSVRSRVDVVVALGQLGQRAAVPPLMDLLAHDPYVPVRAAAATALGLLGGPPALAALQRARRREREAPVLLSIRTALLPAPHNHTDRSQ